jgi:type IV pilus assembly protein PilY1
VIPMKKLFVLLSVFILFSPWNALSHDTDIYTATDGVVQPNLLIMFDNSGSMNDPMTGEPYIPGTTYPFAYSDRPNAVYYNVVGQTWNLYRDSVSLVACPAAQTALATEGFYTGPIVLGTSVCGGRNTVNLRTGNYMNYLQYSGGSETQPKLGLAKGIIQSFVNTTDGIRFGAMIFNSPNANQDSEGGHILREVRDMTGANRADLHTAIGAITADTWTPLAETLYEAGLYYKGEQSYFGKDQNGSIYRYTSPIQYWCQKSYVIVITDGESTKDNNSLLKSIKPDTGDYDNDQREPPELSTAPPYQDDGTDYLDDVAKYLHDSDLSPLEGKQNLTVYTIGFNVNSPLLERAAQNGGGKYYYCHNSQAFRMALHDIINDILEKSSSFVAPMVPISQMESTSAENRLYLAMFKTTSRSFWKGNLKKFQIATSNSGSYSVGDILDARGVPAIGSATDSDSEKNKIKDGAISYWSSTADGGEVELGGVGEILQKRTAPRKIYTFIGPETDLTHYHNTFSVDNPLIANEKLGLSPMDAEGRKKVIKFIHGYDSYDENGNSVTDEKRDWILGAFIHSRPLIIHYGSKATDPSVIFVGGNDGMLHAFDDDTGEELWGFIPANLLGRLKDLNGDALQYFVDGAPKGYIERGADGSLSKAIVIFGQRRGGNRYVALDVTDRFTPRLLWEIGSATPGFPATPGFEELGQTWSTPHIGILQGNTYAAIFGGGYDEKQDLDSALPDDSVGRGVYVVNAITGNLIWSYTNAKNAAMKYCVPSDVTRIDTDGDGYIDRLYVGDIGSRIWRFDIGSADPASWAARTIFNANPETSDRRKMFYPPDVTLEKDEGYYELLFFGTGDREHPKDTTVVNRIYAVKDKNAASVLTENNLVDVTSDELQTTTDQARRDAILAELKSKSGWYIRLDQNVGEKVLSPPVVYFKTAYFTTFTPTFSSGEDPCYVDGGKARTYILQYKTGNAAYNLDASNDLGGSPVLIRSDRSEVVGFSIPSGVIITFLGGTAVAYEGVGGGIYTPAIGRKKSLVPVYWRIVN